MRITSDWLTLIGEHWQKNNGEGCEYWRVEKADSVIVLPLHKGRILCAAPTFRPGIQCATLDFPGGRLEPGTSTELAALAILSRELDADQKHVNDLVPLNISPWPINSAFSNQGLWGLVAQLDDEYQPDASMIGASVEVSTAGVQSLLDDMTCLQCRHVLLEWYMKCEQLC